MPTGRYFGGPSKTKSSAGSVETRMRGGEAGSVIAFSASCACASPEAFSGGGGFWSKNRFTAGEGAATGVGGPVAAGASYQDLPPDR